MSARARTGSLGLWASMLLLWGCMGLGAGWARGETLTAEDYLHRIGEAAAYLESSEGDLSAEEVDRLHELFPEDLEVLEADGRTIHVDCGSVLRWLEGQGESAGGRGSLLDHLRALRESLSEGNAPPPLGTGAWEERQALLDEIYDQEEFQRLRERRPPFWWEALQGVLEAIERWLQGHLSSLGGIRGPWAEFLVYGVFLLMGVILLVWIVRAFGFAGWRRNSPRLKAQRPGRPPERDWTGWRREAKQKADEGAYREAIRCLFVSALLEGHARGWWTYEPQATNREHLGRLARISPKREVFERLMDVYEWAWYGLARPGEEKYRACLEWVRRMEETS